MHAIPLGRAKKGARATITGGRELDPVARGQRVCLNCGGGSHDSAAVRITRA